MTWHTQCLSGRAQLIAKPLMQSSIQWMCGTWLFHRCGCGCSCGYHSPSLRLHACLLRKPWFDWSSWRPISTARYCPTKPLRFCFFGIWSINLPLLHLGNDIFLVQAHFHLVLPVLIHSILIGRSRKKPWRLRLNVFAHVIPRSRPHYSSFSRPPSSTYLVIWLRDWIRFAFSPVEFVLISSTASLDGLVIWLYRSIVSTYNFCDSFCNFLRLSLLYETLHSVECLFCFFVDSLVDSAFKTWTHPNIHPCRILSYLFFPVCIHQCAVVVAG